MAIVEPVDSAAGGRRRLRLADPATGQRLGEVEIQTADDVRAAVERARKAQAEWAGLGFAERGHYMKRALRVLLSRQDEFTARIVRETGKPQFEALSLDLMPACDALAFYARRSGEILKGRVVRTHLMKHKRLHVVYQPMGVVGVITPWNFPFLLSLNPTVQALMAGNAVVLKPSEATPIAGVLLEEIFLAAGLPEGLFSVVQGDASTGAALVEADIDKLSFTGSVQTGRKVGETCGRRLLPCTLELGGKDAMIVCADADLERAAEGAVWGAFANAGQVCMSTERVYVVDEVADEFTEKVVQKTAKLRQGATGEFDVGAIIWAPQLETIEGHVAAAVEDGAILRAGGRRNPDCGGLFYEPTVLTHVTQDMQVMREETFGPVLPIMRVRDESEALRLANDSQYGLNASVWTRNKHKGREIAEAIQSGAAAVNDCMINYAVSEAPFGGVKSSGVGRVNGDVGLRSYCHTRSIVVDRFGGRSEAMWYPYSPRKQKLVQRMMRIIWGTPLGRFLS
jgi:succinate-semialdehyde dehydrogenase/glutarate-semialdehyde dehydrogenase